MALVSDISGVCSNRDTRRMMSSPRNADSMKMKRSARSSSRCMRAKNCTSLIRSLLDPLLDGVERDRGDRLFDVAVLRGQAGSGRLEHVIQARLGKQGDVRVPAGLER